MSLATELRDLEDLRARGTLSNDEFEQAKAQLLSCSIQARAPQDPRRFPGRSAAYKKTSGVR